MTVPVLMPMPMFSSGSPRSRFSAFMACSARCMSTAQCTARNGSSPCENGAPNSTMTASPMNLSMAPPCSTAISVMRIR